MSLPDGLNTVKLGYGNFSITSIQQSGSGNIVTVSADDLPALGDYFYSIDNSNGTSTFTEVTALLSTTTFRIAITSGSGTVSGGTFSKCKQLDVYYSDNENIIIEGKLKKRLDQVILENLIGYRTVLNISTEPLDDTEKDFIYQFVQSDLQRAEVFGVVYSDVLLQDSDVVMDLIQNYYKAVGITLELWERNITRGASAYSPGETSSGGYSSTSPIGTRVTLTMNWGDGDIIRNFSVNLANIYSVKVERKDFVHLDESLGRVTFGFRPMCQINFGTFGFSPTPDSIEADLAWIKNFVLAPTKTIEVTGVFVATMTNGFQEIRVGYSGGFIFAKTLSLSFVGRSLQNNQVVSTGIFTLDDDVLGILDSDAQLG